MKCDKKMGQKNKMKKNKNEKKAKHWKWMEKKKTNCYIDIVTFITDAIEHFNGELRDSSKLTQNALDSSPSTVLNILEMNKRE